MKISWRYLNSNTLLLFTTFMPPSLPGAISSHAWRLGLLPNHSHRFHSFLPVRGPRVSYVDTVQEKHFIWDLNPMRGGESLRLVLLMVRFSATWRKSVNRENKTKQSPGNITGTTGSGSAWICPYSFRTPKSTTFMFKLLWSQDCVPWQQKASSKCNCLGLNFLVRKASHLLNLRIRWSRAASDLCECEVEFFVVTYGWKALIS